MIKYFKKLTKGSFVNSIAILASFTALAQLVPILLSPVITRLYTPEDFGYFAVLMAIITSLLPTMTGQYEAALVVVKKNKTAKLLFLAAIWFALLYTITLLVAIYYFKEPLIAWIKIPNINNILYILPVVLITFGFYRLECYRANRHKKYKLIAHSKLVQSIAIVGVTLLLGLFQLGFKGLLIGYGFGLMVGLSYIKIKQRTDGLNYTDLINKEIKKIAWNYKDYPLLSGSTSLLNGIYLAMPIFFINWYFTETSAGYFLLVQKIVGGPLSIISASVSQVHLKQVATLINQNKSAVSHLIKVFIILLSIVSIPATIIGLYAPQLFSFAFGQNWYEAGVYAQILMPAILVKFIISPMSTTLWATRNNNYLALWKIVAFVSTLIVLITYANQSSIYDLLKKLVILDIILYIFYALIIYYATMRSSKLAKR